MRKDPGEVVKDPGGTLESKASCHMSEQLLWRRIRYLVSQNIPTTAPFGTLRG